MPRLQVYLPDDLYRAVKERSLPASELLQVAIRAVVERSAALASLDLYIAGLEAELGTPDPQHVDRADVVVRAIHDHLSQQEVRQ